MKKARFWVQLGIALTGVILVLVLVQASLGRQRAIASARATEMCLAEPLDPVMVETGSQIYAANCARCHGAALEGSPDWPTPLEDGSNPPPPLNNAAAAWQRSDSTLMRTISDGRNPGKLSDMPAFGEKLSRDEILAVLEFLKSNWGNDERFQQQQIQ